MKNRLNAKADISGLGAMAYEDAVRYAMLGSTVVIGGNLNTDLIKVRRIEAMQGLEDSSSPATTFCGRKRLFRAGVTEGSPWRG
ncbi:MAG: hypothetical protein LBK65_06235 [Tannerellaceae bacterium]|jgi:hypothetical protein|nr:hypothetical protein [Tannerellaceae bacterium]